MKILIVGVGILGFEVLKEISKKTKNTSCFDISKKRLSYISKKGYKIIPNLKEAFDIIIICTKTTEQVYNVVKKINYNKRPLVIIESTIAPGSYKSFIDYITNKKKSYLVFFPHRYYSKDPKYHIFNQKRVMAGADKSALQKGIRFYSQFISKHNIIVTYPQYAALSHTLENSIRYVEIALAEEIAMFCKKNKLNFKEIRRIVNTKWNIDLKEAKNGIGGSCLPKDIKLLNNYFKDNILFNEAVKVDKKYKKQLEWR